MLLQENQSAKRVNSNYELLPRERVVLNSVNQDSASLTGYIYRVSDTLGNFMGWWPFDTAASNPKFAYSILTQNANYIGVDQPNYLQSKIAIYPNPTEDLQTLTINTEHSEKLNITLYDISGREVKNVYNGESSIGDQALQVRLGGLAPGMYFYHIRIGNDVHNFKIIKN